MSPTFTKVRVPPDRVSLFRFDGSEDPDAIWRPCGPTTKQMRSTGSRCGDSAAQVRRHHVSASIVNAGMKRDDRSLIPTISAEIGIVLRPQKHKVLCAYGIDDGFHADDAPVNCRPSHERDDSCVPGCGSPPEWVSESASNRCNALKPCNATSITCAPLCGGTQLHPLAPVSPHIAFDCICMQLHACTRCACGSLFLRSLAYSDVPRLHTMPA